MLWYYLRKKVELFQLENLSWKEVKNEEDKSPGDSPYEGIKELMKKVVSSRSDLVGSLYRQPR